MEGSISKVISLRCLSEIEDQRKAFQNIFRLLKYGGDILVLLTINSYFYDLVNTVLQRDWWRRYFKDKYVIPASHTRDFTADHYRNLLDSTGFVQITIVDMSQIVTYRDSFDFKDDVHHSSLCTSIPEEYRQEFAQEVLLCAELNRFKNNPLDYLEIEYNTLWIHAGKMMPLKKRPYPNGCKHFARKKTLKNYTRD